MNSECDIVKDVVVHPFKETMLKVGKLTIAEHISLSDGVVVKFILCRDTQTYEELGTSSKTIVVVI